MNATSVRAAAALLLMAATASAPPAQAAGSLAAFSRIQEECVQAGGIDFGAAGCRLTRGRWFATLGLTDLYQAQYCIGTEGGRCAQRALVLFANRAYTPVARVVLSRLDAGTAEYDDPVVIETGSGPLLVVTVRTPGAAAANRYYGWRDERWLAVDGEAWRRDLAHALPAGIAPRAGVADMETMSARVPLYRSADADCCPSAGMAQVRLRLAQGGIRAAGLTITPGPQ